MYQDLRKKKVTLHFILLEKFNLGCPIFHIKLNQNKCGNEGRHFQMNTYRNIGAIHANQESQAMKNEILHTPMRKCEQSDQNAGCHHHEHTEFLVI